MILIKNAETPESCGKCRIRRLTEDMNGDYLGICPFLSRRVSLRTGQREKDCPIVDPTEYEQAMIEEILSERDKPRIEVKEYMVDKNSLKKALTTPSGARIEFEKVLNEAVKEFEENYGSQ